MNAKTRKFMTLMAILLTFCLFSLEQSAAQSNCRKIKGSSVQVFDPAAGVVSGSVTNAGILNGTFEDVINFNAGFVFTPDPNVVTYTSDLTITTLHGQLKTSPVITQSIVTGAGTEFGNINPNTSTGRFAGATGLIFITFKLVGSDPNGPYEAEISGDICLARQNTPILLPGN